MGRLRPHPNTTPPVALSGGAQNRQISALFEVPDYQLSEGNVDRARKFAAELRIASLNPTQLLQRLRQRYPSSLVVRIVCGRASRTIPRCGASARPAVRSPALSEKRVMRLR
jgi:hypothetical protein